MIRRILSALAMLAVLPVLGGLPALKRPTRPDTLLHCTKSGRDVVLTWTTTPPSAWGYVICRGVLQPIFRDRIVAVVPRNTTTWTDVGALDRTIEGVFVNEFYRVYAISPLMPLNSSQARHEWTAHPLNGRQVVRYDISNGSSFVLAPSATVVGRDHGWTLMGARTNLATAFLFDFWNTPTPGGAVGRQVLFSGRAAEYGPATVNHYGYDANATVTLAAGDQVAPTSTARALSAPQVSLAGTQVTGQITPPAQDTPGSISALEVWRTYLGVGDSEPGLLVMTLAPTQSTFTDNVSLVSSGWYLFYHWRIRYADGTVSDFSASSAPIRR